MIEAILDFCESHFMWIMVFASFCVSALLIPLIIRICNKKGIYDSIDERKIHKGNIPRLGGIGIIISFSLCMIIYFGFSPNNTLSHVMPIIISSLLIFIFGILDDLCNLRARFKLIVQIGATIVVLVNGFRFKQICAWEIPVVLSYVITFFWIIGIINALNLIDGMDGLCGGLSLFILGALGIIMLRSARPTAGVCFMMCGAITGFLLYNKPDAKIFMGDGGSQFMGFMIAVLPLYSSTSNFEYNKFLVSLVLVSIPVLDTIAAMWRRMREHRSIMSPDSRHIHHKLIALGLSKKQALVILLILQTVLCCGAGLGMYLQEFHGTLLLLAIAVFMITYYSTLHYIFTAVWKSGKLPSGMEVK